MKFTKMQAFGNDYVYIDAINQKINNHSKLAKFISDRHFGVGSDGMVLICPSDKADFKMRIFNPDGTEGEMCGNAIRSVGKYVYEHQLTDKIRMSIETLGGIKQLKLFTDGHKVSNICANIGKPKFNPDFIEKSVKVLDKTFLVTTVSWGNPHIVTYIDDIMDFDVSKYGKELENMTELFPDRTNVTFAQIVDRKNIKIREWERGTGETIGCGTGCATAVVTGVKLDRCDRDVTVWQIGGPLGIKWEEGSDELYMTGPSHTVFEAEIDVSHIF